MSTIPTDVSFTISLSWLMASIAGFIIWNIIKSLIELKYGEKPADKLATVNAIIGAIGNSGAQIINQVEKVIKARTGISIDLNRDGKQDMPLPEILENRLNDFFDGIEEKINARFQTITDNGATSRLEVLTKYNDILEVNQQTNIGVNTMISELAQFKSELALVIGRIEVVEKAIELI